VPPSNPTTSRKAARLYPFHGYTDVKEFAAYAQDAITFGPWSGNLGLRFDQYNGLVTANQVEPAASLSAIGSKAPGPSCVSPTLARSNRPSTKNLVLASEDATTR